MAKKVKVVLNRNAFSSEVLHEAVKPVMDSVQEQMEGMAEVHPSIKVYRTTRTPTVRTWWPPVRPRWRALMACSRR